MSALAPVVHALREFALWCASPDGTPRRLGTSKETAERMMSQAGPFRHHALD